MPETDSEPLAQPSPSPQAFPWRPLWRLAWPWVIILVTMVSVNLASLWVDATVRIALAGTVRWAQSEKDAIRHLRQYLRSGDMREHAFYVRAMDVTLAVHDAHRAFAAKPPDDAIARDRIARVVPAEDATSVVLGYRILGGSPQFSGALAHWSRAHGVVDQLLALDREALALPEALRQDPRQVAAMDSRLVAIEEQLDGAAEHFSFEIVSGAAQLRNFAQSLNVVLALILLVLGLAAAGKSLQRAARAVARLNAANQRFRLALSATNEGIWDWDIRGSQLTWTPRLRQMLGFDSDEGFSGVYELHRNVHPEDNAWAQEARRRHLAGELDRLDLHLRLRRRDGDYRWFQLRCRATRDALGRATRIVGMLTDTHEQHTAQEAQAEALRALRRTTMELELAIDAGQVALWSFDPRTGRLLNIRRWEALLGPVPIPATIEEWQQMVHPDDRGVRWERLQRHLRKEVPHYESEYRMRNAEGRWVWLRSRGCVTRTGADGEPIEYAGAVMDVTEEVDARENQRNEYEFLQTMIEGIEAGVILSSPHRIRYVNDSMCRMLGYPGKEELVGRRLDTLAPDAVMAALMEQRRAAAMAGREVPLAVVELLNARGERVPLAVTLAHVVWKGASHFVSTFTPLDEQQRLRQGLLAAQARFDRILLGELETQQAHIARELHDSLGSVLAGLSLLLETARARAPAEAGVDEVLDRCQEEVLTAAETSRALARGLMPVGSHHGSLQDALEQFAQDLESMKGLSAELLIDADLSDISAPAGNHVYRIVQEAVSNALRHGKATAVRISVTELPCSRTIEIEDNGSGFDPGALPGSHSGMGLRSMQARAQSLGARVVFRHPPEGGFVVTLVLPRACAGEEGARSENPETTW